MHAPPRASRCQVSPGGVDAHSHGRVLGPSTLLQRARVATLGPLSRRRTDASPGGVGQDGRVCVARGRIDAGLVLAGSQLSRRNLLECVYTFVTASLCPRYDAARAPALHLWKHRHDRKLLVSSMANGVLLRARGSQLREHPQRARRRLRMSGSLVQRFPE
ncbi:hypothetical protein VTO73DRAFT_5140 [Trametes versicolor]